MKLTAFVLTILFFITIFLIIRIPFASAEIENNIKVTSDSDGGDSSIKVNISNQVNSDQSVKSVSDTNTKVEIHQEGDGTSQVTVNGKEWKLEGPGDISVNESAESHETPTPSEEENEQTPDLSDITIETQEDVEKSLPEIIKEKVEEIIESIRKTLLDVWEIF